MWQQRRLRRFWSAFRALAGLFAAVLTFPLLAGPAVAQDDERLYGHAFRMAGDAQRTRIVMHFDREPEPDWFLLRGPHRLVVDFPDTRLVVDPEQARTRGMVTGVRYGNLSERNSRLVVSLDGAFAVEQLQVLENETSEGYRMIADLVATSPERFEQALSEQAGSANVNGTTETGAPEDFAREERAAHDQPFTVVIDPGHGGIDGGAEGLNGTVEKTVTLAFGLELRKALADSGRYRVAMTRDSDVFLRLDERVAIARRQAADLFVSIHADTVSSRRVRGATVYTVAERASDAKSAATAKRENLSDERAGFQIEDENQEVANILADLVRRETHSFSIRFARSLIGELSESVELINNPHRYAGFKVLEAPDVPSVLLELGYLSNQADEKLLRDPDWREKAVDSVVEAIDGFAAARPDVGG